MNEKLFQAINSYEAPQRALTLEETNPSLNLAGPTGAGKGTLGVYLAQSGNYAPVVSDTTRLPRPYKNGLEVNGVDYWFISEDEAEKKIGQGAYLEVKAVHQKTMYGTSLDSYQRAVDSGKIPLLEIEVQGMEDLMSRYSHFEAIFLLPPDFDTWQQRLDGRGDMSHDEKVRRLTSALNELQRVLNNPRFHPVINKEVIDTAVTISSGEYMQPEYRAKGITIAQELLRRTKMFLNVNS
ncbi:MAG: guanylate kinase [Candidatus Saccharimonadaceae bacterium]